MRQLILVVSFAIIFSGCSKKQPPPPPPAETETKTDAPPVDTTAADRTKLLGNLKSSNQKIKREAMEELAGWVDTDPESITALLELLKDKTTSGPGRIMATQINSTREAAATALYWSGPKGEAALNEKGFATLREGLKDPQPAIREHTAYTIGLLGPIASALSPDVMKLCTDTNSNVSGRAFDALNSIGVTDVTGFVALLNSDDREIGKLAAQQVHTLTAVPAEAVPALIVALGSDEQSIRIGAAAGLAIAGPKAAAAADALMKAIEKSYPAEFNPATTPMEPGAEILYWRALARIGEPAVIPTLDLLTHTNAIVRALAAQTLGLIGPPAKPAVDKLKGALKDKVIAAVPIEAACALCAIGEGKEDAVETVKKLIEFPDVTAKLAIEAIPRMGEAGKPLIAIALGKLTSENGFARYAAAGLVVTLPPPEATKVAAQLGKLATDKIPDVRHRVGIVLEILGNATAPAADDLGKAYKEETVEIIREQFLDALIAMGPGAKPALPILLPLASEKKLIPAQRIRVIGAIAASDPTSNEVMKALLLITAEGDTSIRVASTTALGKLDPLPPEALTKLVSLAKSDKNTIVRLAAIRAIAMSGPRANPAKAEMEAIAAGPQLGLALWAKVSLASMDGDISKAAPTVRAALTDKYPTARSAAAETLLLIGPSPADLPALIKLLKDLGSTARAASVRCIGSLGTKAKESAPHLLPLLSDGEGDVRIATAEALGNIGVASLPVMERLKAIGRDPLVESTARKAMEKLSAADKK
jgi:HEAT repeat protein